MVFNIDELRNQLNNYGEIIDCTLYHNSIELEIKLRNLSGNNDNYNNIETNLILP